MKVAVSPSSGIWYRHVSCRMHNSTEKSTCLSQEVAMESASSSRASKGSRDTKLKTKGRGHTEINEEGKYDGRDGVFESIGRGGGGDGGPLQCEQTKSQLSEGPIIHMAATSSSYRTSNSEAFDSFSSPLYFYTTFKSLTS